MGGMRASRIVIAVVLVLIGLVWLAQGLGVIGGGAMSGSFFWAIVGAGLLAAGVVVGTLEARRR
jgi:hypothetical protein